MLSFLPQLQNLPLFQGIVTEDIAKMLATVNKVQFPLGALVFSEGEEAQGFYIVLEGAIKLIRITSDGRELVVLIAREGYSVGEAAVYQESTHPISAIAMENTTALFFPRKLCFELVKSSPDFALRMLSLFSIRQRMLTHKLAAQGERNASKRVAGYILHRYFLEGSENTVPFKLSREDLASLLGLARETLSRQLSLLSECGAIELEGRTVYIKDEALLKAKAEGE